MHTNGKSLYVTWKTKKIVDTKDKYCIVILRIESIIWGKMYSIPLSHLLLSLTIQVYNHKSIITRSLNGQVVNENGFKIKRNSESIDIQANSL